jgi:hypothetical protein
MKETKWLIPKAAWTFAAWCRPDRPLRGLSPRLSLPVPKSGREEPTAANELDRGNDRNVRICQQKRKWPRS